MRRDYTRLVGASAGAALLAVAAKLSGIITVANLQGAALRPRIAHGWLPYLDIVADRAVFTQVVTLSTAAMAAVALLRLLPAALRGGGDPDLVAGRLLGVAVAAETLGLEYVRHLLDGPVLAWPGAALVLAALGAGAGAGAIAVIRSQNPAAPTAARPDRPAIPHPRREPPLVPTALISLPSDPFGWDRDEAGLEDDGVPDAIPARSD